MTQASNYLENKILDHILGTTTYTKPTTVYLALFTNDPTDAASGTEVSTGGYSRQAVTFNASSGGSATNSSLETFSASGASFGTITHWALFDASSSGNMLVYGTVSPSVTVASGESISFPIGSLTVTVS